MVLNKVLDYDRPDLVVLNGDLINGDSVWPENGTLYVDQVVGPIIERDLTWASTYGNHDHAYWISAESIFEREHKFPGARTQKMVDSPKAGTTNYYLPVYANDCSDTDECSPKLLLWFFDSRGGHYLAGDAQENWVDQSVVTWFNKTNTELVTKYDKEIPSLAFVHIPINTTFSVHTQVDIEPNYLPGMNNDPGLPQQGNGWCSNGTLDAWCAYGEQDVPFMEALVTLPGIMGLFYGHDHGNSWCYKWDTQLEGMSMKGNGIHLCYGQHSGYGGYTDYVRGAREILVTQDKLKDLVVDTYIRLETGDVVGNVSLNSTFNDDYYPATPELKTFMSENIGDKDLPDDLLSGSSARGLPRFLTVVGGLLVWLVV